MPRDCKARVHRRYCELVRQEAALPQADRFYTNRLRGPLNFNPPPEPELLVRGHVYTWGGYGVVVTKLGQAIERLHGVPVRYEPIKVPAGLGGAPPFVADRLVQRPQAKWELLMDTPNEQPMMGRRVCWFTMWESTRLLPAQVEALNRVAAVFVPSTWNVATFRASGVTVPIHAVGLGIDPADGWAPAPLPAGGPTVFGMAARRMHGGIRKGVEELLRAWPIAFPRGSERVRLRIKMFPDCFADLKYRPRDPRITFDLDPMTTAEMVAWTKACTVGVFPSRSEGWGLHQHEFLACGRPIIAIRQTGVADYFEPEHGWVLQGRWQPARGVYAGIGDWYVPDLRSLVAGLRKAHASRKECRRRGAAGAAAVGRLTWDRAANTLVRLLRAHGQLPADDRPRPRPPKPRLALGVNQRVLDPG